MRLDTKTGSGRFLDGFGTKQDEKAVLNGSWVVLGKNESIKPVLDGSGTVLGQLIIKITEGRYCYILFDTLHYKEASHRSSKGCPQTRTPPTPSYKMIAKMQDFPSDQTSYWSPVANRMDL